MHVPGAPLALLIAGLQAAGGIPAGCPAVSRDHVPGTSAIAAASTAEPLALQVAADSDHVRPGTTVLYTYQVSVPAPLRDSATPSAVTDVAVIDDHCAPVAYQSGDVNGDGILQPSETWTFTCSTTLTETTTSTATASANVVGGRVSASATVTVVVGLPTVFLTDDVSPLVVRGDGGLGTASAVVPAGLYATYLVRTDPVLVGVPIEIWTRSRTGDWAPATMRRTGTDGAVHYFSRITEWTGFRATYAGDADHAGATSHGRIATTVAGHLALKVLPAEVPPELRVAVPGERSTFLVRVLDASPTAGPVTLSAIATGAVVSVAPVHPRPGQVAEVTVTPSATQTSRTLGVMFRVSRGDETWSTVRSLPVIPGTDGRSQAASAHLALWIPWLATNHTELGITATTHWDSTISGARVLIVEHYEYVSKDWELGISWHVMIPPYDWTEIYLRHRWTEDAPSLAFRIDDIRGGTPPHAVAPPQQVMR